MNTYHMTETHGDNTKCPRVQSGEWKFCQGHTIETATLQEITAMRDGFAMAALPAVIGNRVRDCAFENSDIRVDVETAYEYADAMMKERMK